MIRSLVVVGAIGLSFVPSIAALGAPTAVVVAGHRGVAMPRQERGLGTQQDTFKAPEIDVRPKSTEPNMETLYPYRWRGWQSNQNYLLYRPPPWYQPNCFANNLFPTAAPGQASLPDNTLIGSLVDDRSKNMFSSKPSHNPGLAVPADGPAPASTTGLHYEFDASHCTPFNSFSF